MKQNFKNIYQFKIVLRETNPSVWRRIQVPESYTLWDLHVAIQDAMGWDDYHLHEYGFSDPLGREQVRIGIPDEEAMGMDNVLAGWDHKIANWFSLERHTARYLYDFGDDWDHTVTLEEISPREEGMKYPRCTDGEMACPPEDCGGIWGYESICRGEHEFQEEFSDYDPEYFNKDKIVFDNPRRRLKFLRD